MRCIPPVAATFFISFMLAYAPVASATKPCPPSPCVDSANQFDRSDCETSADWIAEGVISDVVHHREGQPTNKDFAEFTFTVNRWEKGSEGMRNELRFTVGWCDNQQELPARTSGTFHIFGLAPKAGAAPRYLHIEPVLGGAPQ